MFRFKKTIIILLLLLLLPLLLNNVVHYQAVAHLPFKLLMMNKYPYIGEYMSFYLFWGSVLVVILLILLSLFILFYPNNKTDIYISKSSGTLSIKGKAIEQFVFAALFQEPWLIKPKVSVVMKKKNFKIFITGDCLTSEIKIIDKTTELSSRLKQELVTFLGIEDDKQIAVEIKAVSSKNTENKRVV